MNLFSGWCFIYLSILGVTYGAHIGNQHSVDSYKQHLSLRIINGKTASITDYPYTASLKHNGKFFGSGVIIGRRWILTTAYNVLGQDRIDFEFRVGNDSYNSDGQVLKIKDIIIHENYTGKNWDYDIALVKVEPITFGKTVQAINITNKEVEGGMKLNVSGWGETQMGFTASDVLLATNVTVLDSQTCQKYYYNKKLSTRIVCTSDKEQGPCSYDYGDPLVANNTLYGLVAGGEDCAPGDMPIIYANVPAYYSWIKEKINISNQVDVGQVWL